jgi:hypothetical protein
MFRIILVLGVGIVVCACASSGPPIAKGALYPLNPGKWAFGQNDITTEPGR